MTTSDLTLQTTAMCGCGSAPSAPAAVRPGLDATDVATPCCGTREAAEAAGACCDPTAEHASVTAGAGCCG
jgi:hypothetical protein